MAIYVVTAVLVGVLAVLTLLAFAIGVLGAFGVMQIARCALCGHLSVVAQKRAGCAFCRHPHLAHPLTAFHRAQSSGIR
jgi:uncharacterized membrane protein YdfJ with MMPL/SSD domain